MQQWMQPFYFYPTFSFFLAISVQKKFLESFFNWHCIIFSTNKLMKFIYSEKATELWRNLQRTSDLSKYTCNVKAEDFAISSNLCGRVRKLQLPQIQIHQIKVSQIKLPLNSLKLIHMTFLQKVWFFPYYFKCMYSNFYWSLHSSYR